MKRLVFCFDGSWNRINEDALTNVALTASAVAQSTVVTADDKSLLERGFAVGDVIPQLIHYDEGVGTNSNEKYGGGMFGKGLYTNVREAYLFLCLNYEPGDEIYLFGFSRGAYTARSFAGLVGNCGIMRSEHIEKVIEAAELYKQRGTATTKEKRERLREDLFTLIRHYGHPVTTCQAEDEWKRCCHGLENHAHPKVDIRYIGLWDTVKSIASWRKSLGQADPNIEFHDEDIPECAVSGRHAVALDEHRKTFNFTPWKNIDEANKRAFKTQGLNSEFKNYQVSRDRAFQEVWFPGTHGSVGGGGERRGLSDTALLWILDGAREQGLAVDTEAESKVFRLKPTAIHFIDNTEDDGFLEKASAMKNALSFMRFVRSGPKHISEVSESAIVRWAAMPSVLPTEEERKPGKPYRPDALKDVAESVEVKARGSYTEEDFRLYNGYDDSQWEEINSEFIESDWKYYVYTVQQDDTLSKIAESQSVSGGYKVLQACNKVMVPDANRVFQGQVLSIPTKKIS